MCTVWRCKSEPLFLRRNRNPNLTPTLGMWTRNQQAATQYREYYCAKFRVIVMRSFYTPWQSDRIIVAAVLRGMKVEWQMQRELAKDDMTRLCWTQKGQRRMETPRKDVINLLYSSIVWVYPVAIVEKFKLFIIKFEKAQKSSRTNFFKNVQMSKFVSQNPHLKITKCWYLCGRFLRFCPGVVACNAV